MKYIGIWNDITSLRSRIMVVSGAGGSSFVLGGSGFNAVNSDGSHRGNSTHYSGKVFTSIVTTVNVRSGDGTAIITYLD